MMTKYLLGILIWARISDTKVVKKELVTHEESSENWAFLERFCFLSIYGTFMYEIEYDTSDGYYSLLLYPDLQWEDAYRNPNAKSCQKKLDALIPDKFQIVHLRDERRYDSGCETIHRPLVSDPRRNNLTAEDFDSSKRICRQSRSFRSARERWWFIAISNCNGTKGLNLKYKFVMTNGHTTDFWHHHFSADQFYILPILTGFCFVYLFLCFSATLFAAELRCRQLFHVTYKLFLMSLFSQNFGIFLQCLAFVNYASNGSGLPAIKLFGRMVEGISEFIFMLLLLLLAKGYTVTRGRLRLASAVKLTIFSCSYIVVYGCLFFFEQQFFDPGLVLYIYESPAGYGILILRLFGWLIFVYAVFFTLKHYPEKSTFYLPFFGIFSLWFVSGPVIILITNFVIDKWVREKISVSIEHFVTFTGHVIFLGLTRPSAANKSFPYHVRTTQVSSNSEDLDDKVDRFDSHSYAPTYVDGSGRTTDVFTVSSVLQHAAQNVAVNGLNLRNPLDVFNVSSHLTPGVTDIGINESELNTRVQNSPTAPYIFKQGSPKYLNEFPHEKPGKVEEMLKSQSDSDEFSLSEAQDSVRSQANVSNEEDEASTKREGSLNAYGSARKVARESLYSF